ncbi:plastocyanin/azurin family copper-binding protein [Flavivirga spongiicola]|uniref:Plastocyanin/azurin family copper-binding protein n=1 Tax=Flavivirga spongiicola TaxID=421621 RepID=A0ABU7XU17_9FLAO|nr:plastocyanin/azurin family copper-binding protein [Flavivirga sp. MEBiC05379]MDO5978332.1 plastocyanin/azurin family copper-binding protein [Flavivirga sp. MEBiC05379]
MKITKYVLGTIFSCAVLIACGGKEEKKKEGFTYENTKNTSSSKDTNDVNEIVISGNDLMQFDKTEIRVKAGEKIKLTLRHKGKLDINVMGHNFVLLKKGVDLAGFAAKAAVAKDNQYIPKKTKDVIAYTSLIGAGQTTFVEFVAPVAGEYDYLCSFPGHYAMMKGKLIVE